MKTWTPIAAVLAFALGLAAPAYATTNVSPWDVVQSNPGTNCTIGRSVINNTAGTVGSTVRSKLTCSEAASDVNLPADRMGVAAQGSDPSGYVCGVGGFVNNATGTAVKSIAVTIYCSGTNIYVLSFQQRKIGPDDDDWVTIINAADHLYFP